jgi:hypothetical protein
VDDEGNQVRVQLAIAIAVACAVLIGVAAHLWDIDVSGGIAAGIGAGIGVWLSRRGGQTSRRP